METLSEVRKRVEREVMEQVKRVVGYATIDENKAVDLAVEARILLEPSPCGKPGHLWKHWVAGDKDTHNWKVLNPEIGTCTLCEREETIRRQAYLRCAGELNSIQNSDEIAIFEVWADELEAK